MVGTPAREFEWLEVLGRGCSGVCRKVRDKNGVLMVVKQIDLSFVTEEEHQNAQREAHLLSSLSHPNIIRFFDDYIDDEMLHIVMEYAPLGTLKQHLNKLTAYMREPQVLWLFTNIVQGLAFLHEHKVMHRDLKSDNIFICEPFVPKLGDFGVAKRLNSAQPMAVSVVGTPLYLSPELCNGQPYNTKSDIWALGVLLYEMCARRAPFQAGNQGAVIKKILMGEFAPLPKSYSEEITTIVSSCLNQDPNLRPSSADLLALLSHHQEPDGPASEPDAWLAIEGNGEGGGGGEEGAEGEGKGGKPRGKDPLWWDWNANDGFVSGQFRTMYGGTPHLTSPLNGQNRVRGGVRGVGGIEPFYRGGGGRGSGAVSSPLTGRRPTSAPSTPSSAEGAGTPVHRDLLDFLVSTPAILEGPLQGPLWRQHPKAILGAMTPELAEGGEDEWLRDSLRDSLSAGGAGSPLSGQSHRGSAGVPLAFTAVDDLTGWLQQYWGNKDKTSRGEAGGAADSPPRSSTRPTSSPDYSSRERVHPPPGLLNAGFTSANKPPTRVLGVGLGARLQAQPPPQVQVTPVQVTGSQVQHAGGGFQPGGAHAQHAPFARGRRLQLGREGGNGGGRGAEGEEGRGRGPGKGAAENSIERTPSTDKDAPDKGLQLQGHGINQHLERNASVHAQNQVGSCTQPRHAGGAMACSFKLTEAKEGPAWTDVGGRDQHARHKPADGRKGMGGTLKRAVRVGDGDWS